MLPGKVPWGRQQQWALQGKESTKYMFYSNTRAPEDESCLFTQHNPIKSAPDPPASLRRALRTTRQWLACKFLLHHPRELATLRPQRSITASSSMDAEASGGSLMARPGSESIVMGTGEMRTRSSGPRCHTALLFLCFSITLFEDCAVGKDLSSLCYQVHSMPSLLERCDHVCWLCWLLVHEGESGANTCPSDELTM